MSKIFPVWSSRIWGADCPLFLFPSKCRFLRHLGRSCLQTKQAKKKNTHTCIHTLLYKMYNFALFSTLPTLPQLIYILIIIFFSCFYCSSVSLGNHEWVFNHFTSICSLAKVEFHWTSRLLFNFLLGWVIFLSCSFQNTLWVLMERT